MLKSFFGRITPPGEQDHTNKSDRLHRELLKIIYEETITPLFQPIVHSKKGTLYGYETGYTGPKASLLSMSEQLFATAREYNLLFALDCLCRKKAIARFQQQALAGKLFLTIDSNCLHDATHQQGTTLNALRKHNLSCKRVVIKLQQQEDTDSLKAAAAYYRNMGFSIAIDDLGMDYCSLQLMNELRPDFIRLNQQFVCSLSHDAVAKEFTRAICKVARSIDCAVIAKGVEQEADLNAIRKLKIAFVQGTLLGAAAAIPDPWPKAQLHEAKAPSATTILAEDEDQNMIGSLCLPIEGVQPSTCAELVFERLQKDPSLMAIPIIDGGIVVGICERNAMLHRFAMRYGHDLYGSKPIRQVMNDRPLITDVATPLDVASPMVTSRPPLTLYEPVVLVENNHYIGLVYVHDILAHMTQLGIRLAMECNPLTRLSGNVSIDREVNRRLLKGEAFILCYIDLDNFKAFNDRYGYERGDVMIRLMADILREHSDDGDFIGHIGGDDFIFVVEERPEWALLVEDVMEDFRRQAEQLYDSGDVTNGCIKAHDRAGNPCTFGLASLSIGAVPCPVGRYKSHLETAEVAVTLKHQAKLHNGNSLQIDRRDHVEKKCQSEPSDQGHAGYQPAIV